MRTPHRQDVQPESETAIVGEASLTIGVDLGGTKVGTALVDAGGRVLASSRRPTGRHRGPDGIVSDVLECLRDACLPAARDRAIGIGVGVAGQVDPGTGTVLYAPNLDWRDFPLKKRLEGALGMPVSVLNDVQAATYGAWVHGAGRGAQDLVCVFVGTGVGGGVIAGGRLLQGCSGSAGELGHMTIDLRGPPCRCGNHGCLEAYVGGWAIARRAREALAADAAAGERLLGLAGADPGRVTAELVATAVHEGDDLARRVVRETGEALAAGIASIVNAFNPCLVILGGGVIEGLPELVDMVRDGVPARALAAPLQRLRIVKAELGPHAGAVGAAAWARDALGAAGAARGAGVAKR